MPISVKYIGFWKSNLFPQNILHERLGSEKWGKKSSEDWGFWYNNGLWETFNYISSFQITSRAMFYYFYVFFKIIMKKSILFFFFADSLTHKAKFWNFKSCWETRWWYFYLAELYSDNQININSHSWICILKSTPPMKSFVPKQ